MKEKFDKLGFIKTKNFCFMKDTLKRMRRQVPDWEKIFAKHISDKGLVSEIYKEVIKLNRQPN